MKKWIVGNWKMHGDATMAHPLVEAVAQAASKHVSSADVVLCPPATLLAQSVTWLVGSAVKLGGQDCHTEAEGAYTGDISAPMLRSAGAAYVIVGHSERRQNHRETSETVRKKAEIAIRSGLIPIICIGETGLDRDKGVGAATAVIQAQLRQSLPQTVAYGDFILAYEPVWAIGSGVTPTADDIRQMHATIKRVASEVTGVPPEQVNVLYGGSVKAANAQEILGVEGVAGVLVGGASLKADDFRKIIESAG